LCQKRITVTISPSISAPTGVHFVVIDRADILDKQQRKLLAGLLLHSDIDQAIVLVTNEEPPPGAIPQDVSFFDLSRVRTYSKGA
jgi:hypothetical protein